MGVDQVDSVFTDRSQPALWCVHCRFSKNPIWPIIFKNLIWQLFG